MLIHKMEFRLLVLFALLGITISQKLYFRPSAELQEEDKATCCLDGKHCCPKGTKCDTFMKACISEDKIIPWTDAQESKSEPDEKKDNSVGFAESVSSVVCPDGAHECENGQTCCPTQDGFACCSFAEAVCCSDNIHCCPKGTVCDVSHSRCLRQNEYAFLSWLGKEERPKMDKLVKDQKDRLGAVRCDNLHECPTGNTCCKLASGDWGCCPKPNAVCCDDHIHCCPHGSTCNTGAGTCQTGFEQIPWLEKKPAVEIGTVQCDDTHVCNTGSTCCRTATGDWGCCPLPNAVCCEDHVHCCPNGHTCDVKEGKCNAGNMQIDWFKKEVAIKVGNVVCDATHECPSGNTCCKLVSGEWGCCPLPQAVCCSDGVHCCPNGYTCDVSSGKCNQGNKQIDWFKKEVAIKVNDVRCDASHECPNGKTCCKLVSGEWGCCPLPNAVCCSDGIHCCPRGTTCDVSAGKCIKGKKQIDWLEKVVAIKQDTKLKDVICPDGSECQDGQTCCRMYDSEVTSYGCCPLPNEDTVPLISIDPMGKHHQNNVPCSGTSEGCPDGDTCCVNVIGEYKCCPYEEGVCCPDHKFCCSKGYICDEEPGICRIPESTNSSWKFLNKVRAALLR